MIKTRLLSMLLFVLFTISGIAQTTIWLEEFDYSNGTTQGGGTPAAWTINSTTSDVWSVQSAQMQATNIGNEAVWTSTSIDIANYSDVELTVDISNGGNMDGNSDYLDVYYILDGGSEMLFAVNGENSANFSPTTASTSNLIGSNVIIVIKINNNKSNESHFFDNVMVTGFFTAVLWTGTTSTDWNTSTNWSTGVVPSAASNVTIPSSPSGGLFPEINSGATAVCNNLTVEPGAHLFVPSDKSLTVGGIITNNAGTSGLVLKSDASGTGSLLHNTDGVVATVEQRLTADSWHYVSSPISNATANVFYDIYLKSFDEPSWGWNPYITDPTVSLEVTRGYSAWVDGPAATVSFEGPLNNGSHTYSVTANSSGSNIGWNLVGNPFASCLDWDANSAWTRTNIDNTIYFWEGIGGGGAGNYHYHTGNFTPAIPGITPIGTEDATQYIPANQAFFIRAAGPSPVMMVDNQARVHNSQSYWKTSNKSEEPTIRLMAQDQEGLADEAIIRFYYEATPEHDGEFDAFKLEGYLYPQLYSITSEDTKLAINTLPGFENGSIIPLGFSAPETGEYSISLSEFVNFTDITLFLEDLQEQSMVNLATDPVYSFSSDPNDDAERFLLHFSENLTNVDNVNNPICSVHSYANNVYIKLTDESDQALVKVLNMMGQEILEETVSGNVINQINVNHQSGYYLVTVQTGDQYISQKVYIN